MSNSTGPGIPEAIFGVGVTMEALVLLSTVVVLVLIAIGYFQLNLGKTVGGFLVGLILSSTLRLVWWALLFTRTSFNGQYVINRLVWMLFSITFLVLLFGWIESVHATTPPPSEKFVPVVQVALVVASCVVGLFILIVIILAFTLYASTPSDGNAVYDANILFVASLQAVVALLFLIYGLLLWRRLSHAMGVSSARQRSAVIRVVFMALVVFVSFGLRAAMFLYRPISNRYFPIGVFYTFAYIIPETVPAFAQLVVLLSTGFQKKKAQQMLSMQGTEAPLLQSDEAGEEM